MCEVGDWLIPPRQCVFLQAEIGLLDTIHRSPTRPIFQADYPSHKAKRCRRAPLFNQNRGETRSVEAAQRGESCVAETRHMPILRRKRPDCGLPEVMSRFRRSLDLGLGLLSTSLDGVELSSMSRHSSPFELFALFALTDCPAAHLVEV